MALVNIWIKVIVLERSYERHNPQSIQHHGEGVTLSEPLFGVNVNSLPCSIKTIQCRQFLKLNWAPAVQVCGTCHRMAVLFIFLNTFLALANMTPQPTSSLCFYQREFITWITTSITPPQTWSQLVHYIRLCYPLLIILQNTLPQNMHKNFTNAYWSDTRSFVQAIKTARGGHVIRKVRQKQTIWGFLPHKYISLFDPFTNICTSFRNTIIY